MSLCLDVAPTSADELRAELARFEERVISQRDALVQLTSRPVADRDALPDALRTILEVSAAVLGVARASIWRYNESRTALQCVNLFESGGNAHSSSLTRGAGDDRCCFAAVAAADIVAAHTNADPRMQEPAAGCLRPLGIQPVLGAPLRLNGSIDGAVCFEHTGEQRTWTADEKSFVLAVSSLVSLDFERCRRQQAERTLDWQGAALSAAADAMVIADRDGALVWVNPAFERLTGYSRHEALGKNPRELLKSGAHDAAFYNEMWTKLLNGEVWRGELTNRRKDGTRYVEGQTITPVKNSSGEVTRFVAIKRDLTEARQMEAQFLQAQKMEAVGLLAGGIAHDFNNLLTIINGTAELALEGLAPRHPLRADFECIRDSGLRAASLTRQLLAFSRKRNAKHESIDLRQLLTNFRGMLQRLIGDDITLTVEAASPVPTVAADPSQIEQVVLNLVVNARDAMPDGGRLTLKVSSVDLDQQFATMHVGAKAGPHVVLAVTDTGAGMSPDTLSRLFEPFFTTKEPGKGTGLGLATVHAIVEQNGGCVWAESELGKGSTFRIYLPVSASHPAALVDEVPPVTLASEIRALPHQSCAGGSRS